MNKKQINEFINAIQDPNNISILVEKPTLKLFVWTKVLEQYSYGTAFALAENVQQARELLEFKLTNKKNTHEWIELWNIEPEVYDSPYCYYQYGSA